MSDIYKKLIEEYNNTKNEKRKLNSKKSALLYNYNRIKKTLNAILNMFSQIEVALSIILTTMKLLNIISVSLMGIASPIIFHVAFTVITKSYTYTKFFFSKLIIDKKYKDINNRLIELREEIIKQKKYDFNVYKEKIESISYNSSNKYNNNIIVSQKLDEYIEKLEKHKIYNDAPIKLVKKI